MQLQYPLKTRIGVLHLDGAFPAARLGIEWNGAAYHRAPDQRERDLRRDAAALTREWAVLQIGHRRGHTEPDVCRHEIATAFRAGIRA